MPERVTKSYCRCLCLIYIRTNTIIYKDCDVSILFKGCLICVPAVAVIRGAQVFPGMNIGVKGV